MRFLTIFCCLNAFAFWSATAESNACRPVFQWRQTFVTNSTGWSSVLTNSDGGFFTATSVAWPDSGSGIDVSISRLSPLGAQLWTVTYGGSKDDYFEAMHL